jgi:nucleoside-diphosphate-sugar epimerase
MTRVLVTGAGGFIGRALCRELAGAGISVVAASRSRDRVPDEAESRDIGDIAPETDWGPALAGVEAVVHLAARVHVMRDRAGERAAYRRVNTDGTRRLAVQAAAAGVTRFVYLSTAKVNGEQTGATCFRESDPPAPEGPYAVSKWEAEQALHEIAAQSGMELVVLRPPLVYGPGVKGNFLALMRGIDRGWPLPLGAIANRRSFIYVGSLVDAVHCCLTHAAAAGTTYLVRDGEDISTPELVRRLAAALGKRARLVPVPVPVLRLAWRIAGQGEAAARLAGSFLVDDDRIRRGLGWHPPFTLAEGLAQTARWFRATQAPRR